MYKLFVAIFILLLLVGLTQIYKQFEDQLLHKKEDIDEYNTLKLFIHKQYNNIINSQDNKDKPNMFIFINYEYNARFWASFGSRSSCDLNQPYLYLTMKTIIKNNGDDFNICIVDDTSFEKLIPNWNYDMKFIAKPTHSYLQRLGMLKLVYHYGGVVCPVSFVCFRPLISMYNEGTHNNKMFVCQDIPTQFMGSEKHNKTLEKLITYFQMKIQHDKTSQLEFLGDVDEWIYRNVSTRRINVIDGKLIGVKTTTDNNDILIDDLMGEDYLDIDPNAFGIYIPSEEILNRRKYEYFSRMSVRQVLESKCIISKYILINSSPTLENMSGGVIEENTKPNEKERKKWVGFWKTDLQVPYYGVRPLIASFGDRVQKLPHPPSAYSN